MSFWAPVLYSTDEGQELRDLAGAFIGRHVVPRNRGYMQSQAMRLLATPGRRTWPPRRRQREELIAAHGYDTTYAMHCARLGFQCLELLTTGELQLPIQGEPADWLQAVRRGDFTFEEWWNRCLALDGQLEQLAGDESYTAGPDRDRIEAWCSRDPPQRLANPPGARKPPDRVQLTLVPHPCHTLWHEAVSSGHSWSLPVGAEMASHLRFYLFPAVGAEGLEPPASAL